MVTKLAVGQYMNGLEHFMITNFCQHLWDDNVDFSDIFVELSSTLYIWQVDIVFGQVAIMNWQIDLLSHCQMLWQLVR